MKTLKPLALQRQGEVVDKAFQSGEMDSVKEWCKQARDLGVLVGVGTHIPEVIAQVEERELGRGFLLRLRLQPHAHRGRTEEGAQRRDDGDAERTSTCRATRRACTK